MASPDLTPDPTFAVRARRFGIAAAWMAFIVVEVYAIVSGLAFASQGRPVESGPYLSIMALLVVVMGPFLVLSMVAVHAYASPMRKTYALAALAFMIACVAITSCVNFMLLFVSSQPELFSESWRAAVPPVQVAGSRIHLGQLRLGLVLRDIDASGGTGLRRGRTLRNALRAVMILSGALCLAGLVWLAVSPSTGHHHRHPRLGGGWPHRLSSAGEGIWACSG